MLLCATRHTISHLFLGRHSVNLFFCSVRAFRPNWMLFESKGLALSWFSLSGSLAPRWQTCGRVVCHSLYEGASQCGHVICSSLTLSKWRGTTTLGPVSAIRSTSSDAAVAQGIGPCVSISFRPALVCISVGLT